MLNQFLEYTWSEGLQIQYTSKSKQTKQNRRTPEHKRNPTNKQKTPLNVK